MEGYGLTPPQPRYTEGHYERRMGTCYVGQTEELVKIQKHLTSRLAGDGTVDFTAALAAGFFGS